MQGAQILIAVDWGTSNFRSFRLSAIGVILERTVSSQGILKVEGREFEQALRSEVGAWLAQGESQILLCGMIGSRQGWVETDYLPCPAGIADLANHVTRVPFAGAAVRLVPGVLGSDAAGVPEVMRGEETAAMGILDACNGNGLACFPGTHSKWIQLSDGKISRFTTSMTGEVFSALQRCTILGRMMAMASATDWQAYHQGVTRSADAGGLLHHLFGVRTLSLLGPLQEQTAASYLSGLLIGHEVRSAMPHAGPIHLVGTADLCALYARALEACGASAIIEDEDAAALGLAAIGRRLQWT